MDKIIATLASARRERRGLDPLPPAPESAEAAYAIQRQVMAAVGAEIGGWKAAGVHPQGAALIAPLYSRDIVQTVQGAAPAAGWDLEVELGFRLGRDVDFAGEATLDAISHVGIAYELCRSRVPGAEILLFLADGLANDGVVLGSSVSTRELDLGGRAVSLALNGGTVVATCTGTHESATATLRWLIAHPPQEGLRASQVIITGSLTGVIPFQSGDTALAQIEGLGALSFTAT